MAFDGFCVAAICDELKRTISDGRISKISQPEKEEVVLTVKCKEGQKRLFISCSPSLPLVYITEENKENPATPPSFLMVLRKHLQGGRIVDVTQPGLERIINIHVEHLDEMGYLCNRILVIEIMGKYSNIILCDGNGKILDAAKRIPVSVSSVREVLPGRDYFIPNTLSKIDPMGISEADFNNVFCNGLNEKEDNDDKFKLSHIKDLYYRYSNLFIGISPSISEEMAKEAINEVLTDTDSSFENDIKKDFERNVSLFYKAFEKRIDCVKKKSFTPAIIKKNEAIKDFYVTSYSMKEDESALSYESISKLLFDFYSEKNKANNMRSKSMDLRKLVTNMLDKDLKKLDLQKKQLKDAENKDKYKLYGELLQAYSYDLKGNEKSYEALNYYNNEKVMIPLDPNRNVFENSQKYYAKYNKYKRTEAALNEQTRLVEEEILYLESIKTYIDISSSESELLELKEELFEKGFIKKNPKVKGKKAKSKITHLRYKDYDIFLGKNNVQNEEVTFKTATGNDWWFHAKGVPGAHVIVKCDKENPAKEWDMPDDVFELAGALAVKYSKHNDDSKHEVDYTRKKHIKKPAEGSTGNVIYHTYYSLVADKDISRFELT